jgi:succinyl-diaminopimelate desuccinylase
MLDTVALAQTLIRFETINPPGHESECIRFLGDMLKEAGYAIEYHPMAEQRDNLIARIGGANDGLPLCFSGHVDVVPLGSAPWTVSPFAGDVSDGKLWGRGSTDMKGGVAAFVNAAIKLAPQLRNTKGLLLIISAGEETGLEGAFYLARNGLVPKAGAMVVAEPTGNRVIAGHKGVVRVEATARGVTAHGSMPENGVNAVYKAARAALAVERLDLKPRAHEKLGVPTVNVGWMRGGLNINSVPDEARLGLDIRTVPGVAAQIVIDDLRSAVEDDIELKLLSETGPVWTDPSDPFVQHVYDVTVGITAQAHSIGGAPYATDAAALMPSMGNPPTVILGPGEPAIAHQTDEYCPVSMIHDAERIYDTLIRDWCGLPHS